MNTQKLNNKSRLVSNFDITTTSDEKNTARNNRKLAKNQVLDSQINNNINNLNRSQILASQTAHLEKFNYKLYAVVMHSGASLNSGHYTSFVNYALINERETKKSSDNLLNMAEYVNSNNRNSNLNMNPESDSSIEWLHFDDTKVKNLSNDEFHRKIAESNFDSPYILFYVKDSV